MAVGQIGEPGAAVPWLVAVEHKHARVLAPILHRPLVALIVRGVVPNPSPATQMDAQVRISSKENQSKIKNK